MNTEELHMITTVNLLALLYLKVQDVSRLEEMISDLQDSLKVARETRDQLDRELCSRGVEVDW